MRQRAFSSTDSKQDSKPSAPLPACADATRVRAGLYPADRQKFGAALCRLNGIVGDIAIRIESPAVVSIFLGWFLNALALRELSEHHPCLICHLADRFRVERLFLSVLVDFVHANLGATKTPSAREKARLARSLAQETVLSEALLKAAAYFDTLPEESEG